MYDDSTGTDFDVLGLCTSGGIEALKVDWKGIYMAPPSNPRVLVVREQLA